MGPSGEDGRQGLDSLARDLDVGVHVFVGKRFALREVVDRSRGVERLQVRDQLVRGRRGVGYEDDRSGCEIRETGTQGRGRGAGQRTQDQPFSRPGPTVRHAPLVQELAEAIEYQGLRACRIALKGPIGHRRSQLRRLTPVPP